VHLNDVLPMYPNSFPSTPQILLACLLVVVRRFRHGRNIVINIYIIHTWFFYRNTVDPQLTTSKAIILWMLSLLQFTLHLVDGWV